jgi:hypothetical protein
MPLPDFENASKWGRWWLSLRMRWRIGVGVGVLLLIGLLFAWLAYGKWALQNKVDSLDDALGAKRDEVATLEARVAGLHRENLHYRELLDPIREKAEQLYPSLERDAAVAQLAKDINDVRELATRDIYKTLTRMALPSANPWLSWV